MCCHAVAFSVTAGREIRLGDGKYDCTHRDCEEHVGLSDGVTGRGISYLVLICLACNSSECHWYVIFTCRGQMAWGLVFLYLYSQTSVHKHLGSWTVQFTKKIFWTQSVSDDVLCLELRTRKPSKNKENPLPNNKISLPHHLPLTPSTLLHTGAVKLN